MKVYKPKKRGKKRLLRFLAIFVVLVSLAIITTIYFTSQHNNGQNSDQVKQNNNPTTNTPATPDGTNDNNSIKQNTTDSQTNNNETPTPISASITAATQNGSLLQIRVLIDNISNSGTCTLNLTKGSLSKTYSVGVQASASSSTCAGFDINTSDLGSTGEWNADITITIDTQTTKLSQKVTIN